MNSKIKGIVLALIGATLWGMMGIFSRGLGDAGFSSQDIAFLRCFCAGVVYLIWVGFTNPKALKVDGKGLLICAGYGMIAYSISFLCYSFSVSRIPVSVATVLMFMSPIWVILISVIVFREKIKLPKIIAVVLCLLGAVLTSNMIGSTVKLDLLGILAGMFNGFGVALQIMIPRYFSKRLEQDTILVYGFLSAALLLLFLSNPIGIVEGVLAPGGGTILFHIFGVGILCTMVANVSFVKSTKYVNTTTTSILSAIEVVVGCIVGLLIFNEYLSFLQILGAVIIVCASLGSEILGSRKEDAA